MRGVLRFRSDKLDLGRSNQILYVRFYKQQLQCHLNFSMAVYWTDVTCVLHKYQTICNWPCCYCYKYFLLSENFTKKNPFWKPFRIFKKNKKLSVWSFSGESQDTKIKYLFYINRDQMDLLPIPCNNDADFEKKNVMWHWNIKCDVVIGLFWL